MQFCPFQDNQEKAVLDVIDQVFPIVLEKSLQTVPQSEKVHESYFELSPTDATLDSTLILRNVLLRTTFN